MKLEVNISKRYLFIIIAVIVIAAAIVGVIAYGTNNPPVFGHSGGEVDVTIGEETKTLQQAIGPDIQRRVSGTCPAGSSIRVINESGGVTCEDDDVGGNPVDCQTLYWYNWQWNSAPSCPGGGYSTVITNCASSHGLIDPLCFRLCERQVCS